MTNRTGNRKIHFFVIEYGAQDKKYEQVEQVVYLENVASYLKSYDIFKSDTDAIYILLTKSDKAHRKGNDFALEIKNHIETYYGAFKNGLKYICEINEINNKELEILPFSLGEVCFQNYCKFNEKPAANVVRIILQRSYSYSQDKLDRMLRRLKK